MIFVNLYKDDDFIPLTVKRFDKKSLTLIECIRHIMVFGLILNTTECIHNLTRFYEYGEFDIHLDPPALYKINITNKMIIEINTTSHITSSHQPPIINVYCNFSI